MQSDPINSEQRDASVAELGANGEKIGVIITNTGSPAEPTPESVYLYLEEFLSDKHIRPMPLPIWRFILKNVILPKRSVTSAEKYVGIWTDDGAPLIKTMRELRDKLAQYMEDRKDGNVKIAMSFGKPTIKQAMQEMKDAGCEKVIAIPLYPQSAYSTTNSAVDKFHNALKMSEWDADLIIVKDYCNNDRYIDAIARSIIDAGFERDQDDLLLFVYHSVPKKDLRSGDTYGVTTKATSSHVAEKLGIDSDRWTFGYQSRFDNRRKWLGPSTTEALDELFKKIREDSTLQKSPRLFVVAPNFAIDCLETQYDIQNELKSYCLSKKFITNEDDFIYVPCLNASDAHVELLSEIISESIS